jgi:serine/threonine protein kinase
VVLVEARQGEVVVKDFAGRGPLVRRLLAPWLIRREERAYRRLEGLSVVPRLIGRLDAAALVIEYRPGELLSRSLRGRVPASFLAELESAITEMHHRGIVHLDLRHRSNILAGQDGRPVLLDFTSAVLCDPSGWLGRLMLRGLSWIDRRALEKWRVRLC